MAPEESGNNRDHCGSACPGKPIRNTRDDYVFYSDNLENM